MSGKSVPIKLPVIKRGKLIIHLLRSSGARASSIAMLSAEVPIAKADGIVPLRPGGGLKLVRLATEKAISRKSILCYMYKLGRIASSERLSLGAG